MEHARTYAVDLENVDCFDEKKPSAAELELIYSVLPELLAELVAEPEPD